MTRILTFAIALSLALFITGCQEQGSTTATTGDSNTSVTAQQPTGDASAYAKEGFTVKIVDDRLWIFQGDEFPEHLPDKHSTFVGAGPEGMTIKAPDAETVQAYLSAE